MTQRPVPPFDLEQCKAQARNGSHEAVKDLVGYADHADIEEHLEIWDVFAEILAESPPSIEVLKKCFLPTEAPVIRCLVVRRLVQGISITLMRYDNDMLQEMSLIEKLRNIWPDMWKWIHSILFYHRHSPLPRSTLTLIGENDVAGSTLQVALMWREYISVMFTPSFVRIFSVWWHELAGGQQVDHLLHQSVCILIKLFVQFEDVPTTMTMVESLGSSASFARCLLAHLRVDTREDSSVGIIVVYSAIMLGCSLTEEIHRELHAQNSVQIVISVLGDLAASGSSETMAGLIEYITYAIRSTGQSQAQTIFKSHILLVLVAVASRQYKERPKLLFSAIANFFDIFGQFCVYRSNVKALTQPMDEFEQENWEDHFVAPELEGAWSLFKECFAEGKRAKERRDSPLKICTSCGTKAFRKHFYQCGHCKALYCNTVCQTLDWRGGGHRSVCVNHGYMMPYKDFETIVHRARTLVARFLPRLALFYHKFVVYSRRNDPSPLLCIIDMTCFPQMITLHPDLSDAAYNLIGNVVPLRLAQSHPCLLVFALLPPPDRSTLLLVHGTLQPSPSYTSYQGFLDSSPDPDAAEAKLQLDISSGSLLPDVSFHWVTGGGWDNDKVSI
ncbi:hypothetical protein ONZ45_g11230 [Pleurotus djamor]|nr:hypothetical protein ONZ45_g11230 [Pleurotus djamor]